MSMEYKQRHPLAWSVIVIIVLGAVAALAASRGWLPIESFG